MTLTEILIVLAVLATVAAIALPMFAPWGRGQRISAAARIVQSALVGARDRAIRDQDFRGLLFDTRDNRTMYVTQARTFEELDTDDNGELTRAEWMTDVGGAAAGARWDYFSDLFDSVNTGGGTTVNRNEFRRFGDRLYVPVERMDPIQLPEYTEFDFTAGGSKARTVTRDTSGAADTGSQLDDVQQNRFVVFNPTGTAEGPGMVLIYLRETTEAGGRIAVVLFCRTGLVGVYDVDPSGTTLFDFVDTGAKAGQ